MAISKFINKAEHINYKDGSSLKILKVPTAQEVKVRNKIDVEAFVYFNCEFWDNMVWISFVRNPKLKLKQDIKNTLKEYQDDEDRRLGIDD